MKMAASIHLYFIRANYILLRKDIINSHCISKEKSVISKKHLLIQKTSRIDRNHFLILMISHVYHPNQTQTQTNKITRRPSMHNLVNITPTQLLLPLKHIYFNHNQIQKKSYPQKRRLSFHQLFPRNKLKHNLIQYQCQSN